MGPFFIWEISYFGLTPTPIGKVPGRRYDGPSRPLRKVSSSRYPLSLWITFWTLGKRSSDWVSIRCLGPAQRSVRGETSVYVGRFEGT